MGATYAELHVAGRVFVLRRCTYGVSQATGPRGRPIEQVRHLGIDGEMDVPRDSFVKAWAAEAHMPQDGYITFSNGPGEPAIETVSWEAGECVGYGENFHKGSITDGSYTCHWRIVAAKLVFGTTPPKPFVAAAPREHGTPPVAAIAAAAAPAALSKQQRYDARMKKLAAARAQLAATEPARNPLALPADATRVAPNARLPHALPDYDRLQAATERLARNNVAVERAKLADDSYENEIGPGPDGKPTILRKKPLPDGWRVNQVIEDKQSGFMAVVYTSDFERPPRKVVAFRGTDVGQANDAKTDFMQGIGMDTVQYRETEDVAKLLKKSTPEGFDITGHSLGGGEASLAGLITGQNTYTFNAAGLHVKTMARAGIDPNAIALSKRKIQAYYSTHDPLSLPQDNPLVSKAVLHALLVVPTMLVPPLGPVAGSVIDNPDNLPGAVGIRRAFQDAGMHPIPPMVARIEEQKDEDLATINQLVPPR